MVVRFVLFTAAATAAVFFAPAPVRAAAPWPEAAVARAVDDTMARYGLPGIAVGVVADGEVRHYVLSGEPVYDAAGG